MTTAEAKRHDLYNVLTETIGAEETDTLMAYLPTQPHEVLATKADIADLGERVETIHTQLSGRIDFLQTGLISLQTDVTSLRAEMSERIDSVNRRLDRLFLTLAAGLLAVVGAVVGQALI